MLLDRIQLLRVGNRERAQHDRVEHREDRRGAADAQRQREHGDGGDERAPEQQANRVAGVPEHAGENSSNHATPLSSRLRAPVAAGVRYRDAMTATGKPNWRKLRLKAKPNGLLHPGQRRPRPRGGTGSSTIRCLGAKTMLNRKLLRLTVGWPLPRFRSLPSSR